MSKISRYNEVILEELALAVNRELALDQVLITITYVDCSPDLKQAKVGFSVLPDNLAGTALRELKKSTHNLIPILKKRLKLRRLPRLIWEFDASEREAGKIDNLINALN